MIFDVRWLERPVPSGVETTELVLQFRIGYHSSGTGLDVWEEWQDVPVVPMPPHLKNV